MSKKKNGGGEVGAFAFSLFSAKDEKRGKKGRKGASFLMVVHATDTASPVYGRRSGLCGLSRIFYGFNWT
jgi:hypothetical protein